LFAQTLSPLALSPEPDSQSFGEAPGGFHHVIEVDVDFPENNREVKILKFVNVEKDGVLRDGFEIMLQGDIRDVAMTKYYAKQTKRNEIMLELPSAGATYLERFDSFFRRQEKTGQKNYVKEIEVAHQVTRNAIKRDLTRQTKTLTLVFPQSMVFDHVMQAKKSGEVVMFQDKIKLRRSAAEFDTMLCFVYWRFFIYEKEQRLATDDSDDGCAKLLANLSSMGI